ncbi:MAG TPA: tRNA-uridine aminocarboxypropyltransferase [Stellaceae bacterium]|nr:tRNA-uridine aminocarboxypropyltransferase [Stellaceae bacterium]
MPDPSESCPRCQKTVPLCVCEGITPLAHRIEVLILQHPREQDKELGTARLCALSLEKATLKIGLSWPSLGILLERKVDPKRWAVAYLGSVRPAALAPSAEILVVDAKGTLLGAQEAVLQSLEGVILLDGTWSEAKALWWRNPWMLKTRRLVLGPRRPSRYGRTRREPRREGLATIEAAGLMLARLEGRPEIEATLTAHFERQLARYKSLLSPTAGPA